MEKESKLFDKRFVYFMWDDELEGMGGFFADNIGTLKEQINNGVAEYLHNTKSRYEDKPFANCNSAYRFFYYDPNYEVKKAFNEGKTIQYQLAGGVDWADIDSEEALECVKPEEKWIAYLARQKNGLCYLTACREDIWEDAQKDYGAKTKLFIGAKSEVEGWYASRRKFAEVIKAWEDGKKIQVYGGDLNDWLDVSNPRWDFLLGYRVKPECPCEEGIDSKACAGCEHSEDGKKAYRPYESSVEMIVDFIDRFKVNCPSYCEPLIWVKTKSNDVRYLITGFGKKVSVDGVSYSLDELFKYYTYLDGSPCGVEY